MSFRWGERKEVIKNRKNFLKKLGITPENCAATSLEHETTIKTVDGSFRGRGMLRPEETSDADCLITRTENLFLFLLTGDCLPIIFYDSSKKLVALAHLSRINTPLLFVKKIVDRFGKEGSVAKDIVVGIGPGVRRESYVFDRDELVKRTAGHNVRNDFLVSLPNRRMGIDLVGYNIFQLVSAGVPRQNIEVADKDSIRDTDFFSHYRSRETGEKEGRMAAVVGMVAREDKSRES